MKWTLSLVLLCCIATRCYSQFVTSTTVPAVYQDMMISLTNYAAWDDSLTLMWYPSPSALATYISLNLPANVMRNMPVNFVGYYFPNGTAYIQLGYNYSSLAITGTATPATLPSMFLNVSTSFAANMTNSTTVRFAQNITYYDNTTVMVAGCPIFHSDYTGIPGGFVLFGLFASLLPSHNQYFLNYVVNLAAWDTSYKLMQDLSDTEKATFLESNFAFQSMQNNYLNFAAYYKPDGTPYFTIGYDFTSSTPYAGISMPQNFQTVPANVISAMGSTTYRYVDAYAYRNRFLDVVGCPIIHTDGTGPVVGFALFARFRDTSQPLTPDTTYPGSFASTNQYGLSLIITVLCMMILFH